MANQESKSTFNWLAIIVFVIFGGISSAIIKKNNENKARDSLKFDYVSNTHSELVLASNEINRTCPFLVDSNTRLDNTAVYEKTLIYNYTLLGNPGTYNEDEILEVIRPRAIENFRTNPGLEDMRLRRVTFEYYYKDESGAHITTFKVGPTDYLD